MDDFEWFPQTELYNPESLLHFKGLQTLPICSYSDIFPGLASKCAAGRSTFRQRPLTGES